LQKFNFNAYLKVPRDKETIVRSIQRKLHRGYDYHPHDYISGDSFKAICDFELNVFNWRSALMSTILNSNQSYNLFVPGGPRSNVSFELVKFLENSNQYFFPNVNLIFHNGDFFPGVTSVIKIAKLFKRIYAVNWLGRSSNVTPIPIGLENEGYLLNGVLKDYLSMVPKLKPWNSRDIQILACFSIHTNPSERAEALYFAKQVRGTLVIDKPVTPRQHRELISNSKFVISPPGNGYDCHRTWESLFLGAVPIVKKSFWPFSNHRINVQALDKWENLLSFNDNVPNSDHESFYENFAKIENWIRK
jgi:hypothetical protein